MSSGAMVSPKTIVMGVTPASIDVEPGDTLVFTNNSAEFPKFEVEFDNSPNGSGPTFPGTTEIKIVVTKDGTFNYSILHFRKSGPAVATGAFSVRSCTGGCPSR
jgi:plastocyanin